MIHFLLLKSLYKTFLPHHAPGTSSPCLTRIIQYLCSTIAAFTELHCNSDFCNELSKKKCIKNSPSGEKCDAWEGIRSKKKLGGKWGKAENVQTFEKQQLKRMKYKPDSKRKKQCLITANFTQGRKFSELIPVKV